MAEPGTVDLVVIMNENLGREPKVFEAFLKRLAAAGFKHDASVTLERYGIVTGSIAEANILKVMRVAGVRSIAENADNEINEFSAKEAARVR